MDNINNFGSNTSMQETFSAYQFERYLVEHIARYIERTPGLDHSKFAREAFHDQERGTKAAVDHWKRLRQEKNPARLTVEDAVRIARAMGHPVNDFVDLMTTKCRRHYQEINGELPLALAAEDPLEYGEKKVVNG